MGGCIFCSAPFTDVAYAHVCSKCGAPQPISPEEDHFSLLGVKRGFQQNLPELENRFYAISRTLHPDRFAAGGDSKWKVISVERMSAVNRAYQTLTKADRLREYLLTLEGVPEKVESPAVPADLAEEWFELQDTVLEDPSHSLQKLGRFESDLRARAEDLAKKIKEFEHAYDAGTTERREVLRKIEKLVLDAQYLKSMERDLLKLKIRLGI